MTTPEVQQAFAEALVRRANQEKEYGKYVATQVIPIGNAVAFNVGDPVPISHVEKFGWEKEGKVALREDFSDSQSLPGLPSKESEFAALKAEGESKEQSNPASLGKTSSKAK